MTRVHIDTAALDRLARSTAIRAACRRTAEAVADAVRAQGHLVGDTTADGSTQRIPLPVEVVDREDGAAVVIDHPAATAIQAKDGALTRAAAQHGLEVRS